MQREIKGCWQDEEEYLNAAELRRLLLVLLRAKARPRMLRQHIWLDACWYLTRKSRAQSKIKKPPEHVVYTCNCPLRRSETARLRRDKCMWDAWDKMLVKLHEAQRRF